MAAVESVVIVGGGISGLALAIGLAQAGVQVEVLENSADGNVSGIGMALQAPALRALDSLGLLPQIVETGFAHETATQLNLAGDILSSRTLPRPLGGGCPGQLGIQRTAFHRLLLDEARRLGVVMRFGITVVAASQHASEVHVVLSDTSRITCDLVVGADGAYSAMRRVLLGSTLAPEFTGQATWRIAVPRPAHVRGMCVVLGGPLSVGINPVTDADAYVFVVENIARKERISEERLLAALPHLLRSYGGLIAQLVSTVHDSAAIVYRPLDSLIMPPPWHRGRAILIGDAAHATTPHMAAGALIALQDAVVLTEELVHKNTVVAAFERFMKRRYARCRLLVDACRQIGDWQKAGRVGGAQAAELQAVVLSQLAAPV